MPGATHQPDLLVPDVRAWRTWLRRNHARSDGVWLILARKGTVEPTSLVYAEALDEALCHGWIDGQAKSRDDATFQQRWTPRRVRSPWSARNVTNAERLVAEGRMKPPGQAEIDRAKADGRWDRAYATSATIEVPPELAAALEASPDAARMFAILTAQNRFAIIYRMQEAKRADTRERRMRQFVEMLERGETVYPQKRRLDD